MDVLVVGLGSMGKRRARLLGRALPGARILGVDSDPSRRQFAADSMGLEAFASIEEAYAAGEPRAAFACTSPLGHGGVVRACLARGSHVFTELNLVGDEYPAWLEAARARGLVLFMSSTLLYRKDVQRICAEAAGRRVNYLYHVGQYLPDWHPWESYKSFFVGDRRTNGCREILAIDLPWILRAFGPVERLTAMKDKNSSLEIDYCDNYIVSFEHAGGSKGVVCADVVSPKAVRALEVFGEGFHLFWEGSPTSLSAYNPISRQKEPISTYEAVERDPRYSDNIIENAYLDEILAFFRTIDGGQRPIYTIEDDAATLALIDRIEAP